MATKEEGKEARFHLYVCEEALEPLHRIKMNMVYIEADRAKRYSRTDSVAVKAREVQVGIDIIEKKLGEILGMIQKEKKHL